MPWSQPAPGSSSGHRVRASRALRSSRPACGISMRNGRVRCGPSPRYGPAVDDADGYFGEPVAATYDEESAEMFAPAAVDPAVDLLAGLAGDGRALELGIGTGRIALPLARRGVPVHGIDLSRAMVARLRAKPGGAEIDVTIGDFATAREARASW